MATKSFREAIREAMDEEMERDKRVFLIGEEVAQYDGAYKVSQGLLDKYGEKRVVDTPITEEGFAGVGIGAAMAGLRPIVEFMTFNFSIQALDQILNNAAKMRYMSGGQFTVPIVFRGPNGAAESLGAQHSQSLEAVYSHFPGLKVVEPSTPADAKGLLKSSIRDDNPVVYLESEMMYGLKGEVPDGEHLVPLGVGDVKRAGSDATIVSYGKVLRLVEVAASKLAEEGVEVEVIDPRTLKPLDEELIYASVRKTGRCVVVAEPTPFASVGSHIAYLVSRNVFDHLDAPVELVAADDIPMPYNWDLERATLPTVEKIVAAVKKAAYL